LNHSAVLKAVGARICLNSQKRLERPGKHPPAQRIYMGLGTKHRQRQTADICKQHLREKYPDKLELVEEFIVEIEGPPKSCDLCRWAQFTDIKDIKKEMLQRLEIRFENWLNP